MSALRPSVVGAALGQVGDRATPAYPNAYPADQLYFQQALRAAIAKSPSR